MINKETDREKPLALIVDDDASLRITMRAALMKTGIDVVEAENGRLAIELFKSEKPDLVLLDVMMPELNGFEACTAIRSLPGGNYVQILMVTGLDDTESIERALAAGANDFVSKPLNWVMLGHRVNYMLRAGRSFQEMDMNRRLLARTQKIAKLGNWEVNLINGCFYCSPEAKKLLGFAEDDGPINLDDFLSSVIASDQDTVIEKVQLSIKEKSPFSINYQTILPSGQQKHIYNQGEILCDECGHPSVMMGAVQDVTKLKLAEEEIRRLAFYDGLTGLANRTFFFDRLEKEINNSERNNQKMALLFLDLDNFKNINDTFGHHVGDLVLKKVSENLHKCIRGCDSAVKLDLADDSSLVSRLGGDEFLIMLSNIKAGQNAATVASRITNEIPRSYDIEGHEITVTTSIGISIYPVDADNAEDLVKYADSAMYQAKEAGRNNYQFFDASLNASVIERLAIENDIRKAIDGKEFHLYYQPQIDMTTRKIIGAEALIRWPHLERGMIPPDKFIPIAEDSGQIIDINRWVIQTACRQNTAWLKAGMKPVRISVNLSGYQFVSQNIVKTFEDELILAKAGAINLDVEITENILMRDTESVVAILDKLKSMSLRIALDDFGTGYSSLSYLASFPVDIIKIDRSFVMGLTLNNDNLVIIKAIIAMGHSLGMKIIAEGVETEEEFDLLREHGVDEVQGFYFSPAVPYDEFASLMEKGTL